MAPTDSCCCHFIYMMTRFLQSFVGKSNFIPVVHKCMNASIIGADMCFAKLPQPFGGVIYRRRRGENLLRCSIWILFWQSKLDGNRLQSSHFCEEENCGCRIGFALVESIDPIQKWQVNIMII